MNAPKSVRDSYLDCLRGFCVTGFVWGHANQIMNPFYPSSHTLGLPNTEAAGSILKLAWNAYRDYSHAVAFFLILLGGFNLSRYGHRKTAFTLVTRGAALVLVDVLILSFGWTFPFSILKFKFMPLFEALGCLGVCLMLGYWLIRIPSWLLGTLIVSLVCVQELALLLISRFESTWAIDFLFFPVFRESYGVTYNLFGWLPIFALGILGERFLAKKGARLSWIEGGTQKFLFGVGLCAFIVIVKIFGFGENTAQQIFHFRHYPPSLWYLLNSASFSLATAGLIQLAIKNQLILRFLDILGQRSLWIYLAHPFFLGLFKFCLFSQSTRNPWADTAIATVASWIFLLGAFFYYERKKNTQRVRALSASTIDL